MLALAALATLTVASVSSPRAIWVWGTEAIRNEKPARAEFFSFIEAPFGVKQNNISVLFFDGMSIADLSDAKQLPNIRSFVIEAHRKKMRVDFLTGDASWALPTGHDTGLSFLQAVLKYNQAAPVAARFDGIQYDVEPYLLKGWPDASMIEGYLSFLDKAKALAKGKLLLGAAIPRWFDEPMFHGLHKKVIDRLDYVALMDYVDTAPAFVNDGKNEVDYASQTGKKAWLGAETQALDDEPTATFFAKGNKVMEQAFNSADSTFKGKKGYGGVAIHFYDSYKKLKP